MGFCQRRLLAPEGVTSRGMILYITGSQGLNGSHRSTTEIQQTPTSDQSRLPSRTWTEDGMTTTFTTFPAETDIEERSSFGRHPTPGSIITETNPD